MIMLDGNKKLKEKYGAKVIGYIDDKKRIPEIDITVKNNQILEGEKFEAKIYIYLDIQVVIFVFIFLMKKIYFQVIHYFL